MLNAEWQKGPCLSWFPRSSFCIPRSALAGYWPASDRDARSRPDERRTPPGPASAPAAPPQSRQEVTQPGVRVVDGEERIGPVPSTLGVVPLVDETPAEQPATDALVAGFVVGIENDTVRDHWEQGLQHLSDCLGGAGRPPAVLGLVLGHLFLLPGTLAALAAQRRHRPRIRRPSASAALQVAEPPLARGRLRQASPDLTRSREYVPASDCLLLRSPIIVWPRAGSG